MTKQEYTAWKKQDKANKVAQWGLDKQNNGVCGGFTEKEYIKSIQLQSSTCKSSTRVTYSRGKLWN